MRLLQATALAYRYPDRPDPLFRDVALDLHDGDRAALIGPNGAGKSTLLALLAGALEPTEGTVVRHAPPLLLRQEDRLEGAGTALQAMLDGTPLGGLHRALRDQERQGLPDPLGYADRMQRFSEEGGFERIARFEAEAAALGFPPGTLERPLAALSGGERRRLLLAALLAQEGRLRLLDEPTNHLDVVAREALAERLTRTPGATLLVSHDRWLLERVATEVLELERGRLRRWRGGYLAYRAEREADLRRRERQKDRLEREIDALRASARSYAVWGGRKEKEKSGALDKGFVGARAARLQKRAVIARDRALDRAETLASVRPWVERRYRVAFAPVTVPTGTCLVVSGLRWTWPGAAEPVLDEVSFSLDWGERLALAGPNGAGKSTLLRLLVGELEPHAGRIAWADAAEIGYLPQQPPPDPRPLSAGFSEADAERARQVLGALGVPGEAFDAPPAVLSEGQRRKVALARMLVRPPDVLLLDEPGNHLDLESLEMLEAALSDYPGALLLVSHDRALQETLTPRRLELPGAR